MSRTHVPWCMSGSLIRGGGENVPGIPGACSTHKLTYLSRGPFLTYWQMYAWWTGWWLVDKLAKYIRGNIGYNLYMWLLNYFNSIKNPYDFVHIVRCILFVGATCLISWVWWGSFLSTWPLLLIWFNSISTWISSHSQSEVKDEITYPFPASTVTLLKFWNGSIILSHTLWLV